MGFRSKDGRFYPTWQDVEEADQRFEQTQLLKKQVDMQREAARQQEKARRRQELQDKLQAMEHDRETARIEAERTAAIRIQNQILDKQARWEKEEQLRQEEEEFMAELSSQKRSAIETSVYPLLREASIQNPEAFLEELERLYNVPRYIDNHEFVIAPLSTEKGLYFAMDSAIERMSEFIDLCDENQQDILIEIENAMKDIRFEAREKYSRKNAIRKFMSDTSANAASGKGLLSFLKKTSIREQQAEQEKYSAELSEIEEHEKKLETKANNLIQQYNNYLLQWADEETKEAENYAHKIAVFEERRIRSFNPALEYALEQLTQIEEKYESKRPFDYRLKSHEYPSSYLQYKRQREDQVRSKQGTSLFSGLTDID